MDTRSPSGRYHRWDDIIQKAQALPGTWQFLLPNSPASVVKTIGLRRHPALRRDDGRLEAQLRNEYKDESGKRRANVMVRWVPVGMITEGEIHTKE